MMRQPEPTDPDQIAANYDSDVSPERYEEKAWVSKVHQWFRDSNTAFERWRANAVESLRFLANDQWEEAVLQRRGERPTLVINRVRGPIEFLCGVQVQRRVEPVVLPFEPSDAEGAKLMNYLLKWTSITSDEPSIDSLVFRDKAQTAIGYWKVCLDFHGDPGGEPRWEKPHPLSIYGDPNWLDGGWPAAKYVMHATWMDCDEAADSFPEHRDAIKKQYGEWLNGTAAFATRSDSTTSGESAGDSLADQRLFWDKDTQRIRLLEVWHKRHIVVPVAVIKETGEAHGDPETVERFRKAMALDPEMGKQITLLRPAMTQVYVSRVLANLCVDPPQDSPFDEPEFPIFPTLYHYSWRTPTGAVDDIKDPQRWQNYAHSAIVEVIGSIAHSGWKNHKSKGADAKELRDQSAGIAKIVNYEEIAPIEITAPPIDQSLVLLMRSTADMIPEISGVTRELSGQTTQRTVSGRAIKARQQGSLTLHESVFDSFERDKAQAVKFMIAAIQQYTPLPKAMRILGSLAARNPQGPEAALLAAPDQGPVALQELLQNTLLTKFDAVVDSSTRPWEPTVAQANLQQLTDIAQQFPVPPQVLIKAAQDAGVIDEEQAQMCYEYFAAMQQQQAVAAQPH